MRTGLYGVALAALAVGLGGCAGPEVTELSLEDGAKGQVIDCGGVRQSMNDCIAAANATCEGDYALIGSTQTYAMHTGAASVLDDYDRALLIRCREE